jgi:Pro-kumamolisin, activation domain/IPT/TIG domain
MASRRSVPRIASLLGLVTMAAVGVPAPSASAATVRTSPPAMERVQDAPRIPAGARAAGAVPASARVSGTVVLKPRDNAALVRFIAAVADKNSPMFHQYLPPGAFAGQFGPRRSSIVAVQARLRADGLTVTGVSSDGLLVSFSGTARRVEAVFRTGLERYTLANGRTGQATTSAVSVPRSIASSVTAVLGLNALIQLHPVGLDRASAADRGQVRPAATTAFPHPAGAPDACPAATAAALASGGLTDDQIAHAYGAFGLYGSGDTGAGQHIALYELEPFARSDIRVFDTCYFGRARAAAMMKRLHVIPLEGGQPAGSGSGEALLDVEDLSGIAPGATINVYEAPSYGENGTDYDPVDNYAAIIDSDQDQIISTSWGLCEQAIQAGQPGLQQAENLLFEQAAAQGMSIFGAAGDNGSDDCNTAETSTPVAGQNPLSVDDPGSQPFVVSVGGLSIDSATEPPAEHVWNDGSTGGGGGGGISQSWAMPSWQRTATTPGIALPGSATYAAAGQVEQEFGYPADFCQSTVAGATSSTPCRLVPDVSAQADQFTGAITVYQQASGGWQTTGGTSSATPIWAATLALVNASPTCRSQAATRSGVGFVSPLLYAVASNPAEYKAAFTDVTAGNNDTYGLDNGKVFRATPGYDLASGLGSPELTGSGGTAGLAYDLCSLASQPSRPVVTALTPAIGSTSGRQRVTITGTGFTARGEPDVASIEVGAAQLRPGQFAVRSATTIVAVMPPARAVRPPDAPAPQDGAGPAVVIVTLTGDVSSAASPGSRFEYVDTSGGGVVPSVTGVVATSGPEAAPAPVTILGSALTGATSVTFGGVAAASFTVNSANRITATPPAYSAGTACAPLPRSGVYAGENASNDICQVQVRVANAHGTSATGRIRPPAEGAVDVNSLGVLVAPAGCDCETMQAPTEYDYVPAPVVTSISTSAGAASLASEHGGTVVTVHGRGFDPLGIDWADFGNPAAENSMDTSYVFLTGTEMQLVAPSQTRTTGGYRVPFSVTTPGGQSRPVSAAYAGLPAVTSVVNTVNSRNLDGTYGAQDTGGAPIRVSGRGFAGQLIGPVEFNGVVGSFSNGTQYTFSVRGSTSLTTQTVAQNPALVSVQLCTVTGCSPAGPASHLYVYPPGRPTVTSMSPSSGPARGGTKVTIRGQNLGCTLQVYFGKARARSFTQIPTFLYCGSTNALNATSPGGKGRVLVTVETAESFFAGTGRSTSTARFRYR